MELALLKTMMDRDFYEAHKGSKCPDELFGKDVRRIKQALDSAMKNYEGSLGLSDLQAVFNVQNQSMTRATRTAYDDLFERMDKLDKIKDDIAQDTLSTLHRQRLGDMIAQYGFDCVNGSQESLEPLRRMLEDHSDDFTPNLRVDWEDISIDRVLDENDLETQWKFNISTLRRKVEGVSGGHLLLVGARPNTGKTSFHASLVAGPDGWAHQGAKCIVLCNEEGPHRVAARYLCAATNMSLDEVKANKALAQSRYAPVAQNIRIKDSTNKDMHWVESVVKNENPDIVVLDMGDKFAPKTSDKSDVYLKDAAIHARNIAKQYKCCVLWMSQLSAAAEGIKHPDQSMMEGSKTGKAAEADLMILIAKEGFYEGQAESEQAKRHLNIAKNKLRGGYHGSITCVLDGDRALYSA